MGFINLLIFVISILAKITLADSDADPKAGKCLPWLGPGPCVVNCQKDADCGGAQKCCSVGCGRLCQDPCKTTCDFNCNSETQCKVIDGCAQCVEKSVDKPGKCLPWNGPGPCIMSCRNDTDCSGQQKCCGVGCGRMCQNPCAENCADITCAAGAQCKMLDECAQCFGGTDAATVTIKTRNTGTVATTTSTPRSTPQGPKEKPGKCVSFKGPSNGSCVKNCATDFNCTGTMKCCQIGCGTICTSVCSKTCDFNCGAGNECKLVDGCATCVVSSTEKAGICEPWEGTGPCLKNCEVDNNCSGTKKCCSIGCGKICQEPCSKTCDWNCLPGKECRVINGCAKCV